MGAGQCHQAAIVAVGVIQRDGVFVAAGSVVAIAWVGFLSAVAIGLALGAGWAASLFSKVGGDAIVSFFQGLF